MQRNDASRTGGAMSSPMLTAAEGNHFLTFTHDNRQRRTP
jgi:hypothetical protein